MSYPLINWPKQMTINFKDSPHHNWVGDTILALIPRTIFGAARGKLALPKMAISGFINSKKASTFRVVEGPQGPISDAEVFDTGSQVVGGNTLEDGTFSLQGLPPGRLCLVFSRVMPQLMHQTLTVPPNSASWRRAKNNFPYSFPRKTFSPFLMTTDLSRCKRSLCNDNSTVGRETLSMKEPQPLIVYSGTYFFRSIRRWLF